MYSNIPEGSNFPGKNTSLNMAVPTKSTYFSWQKYYIRYFAVPLVCCAFINIVFAETVGNISRMVVFKMKLNRTQRMFQYLQDFNLTQLFQITPSTYIFEYRGPENVSCILTSILRGAGHYRDEVANVLTFEEKINQRKIAAVEPVREYKHTFRNEHFSADLRQYGIQLPSFIRSNLHVVYDDNYGMGVPEAWSLGYSGRGVTIAVTDVGVNTELEDLKDNIDNVLSYNFVDQNKNVTPEFFHHIKDKATVLTDHGNKVASIIAATKGNNLCSAGIAYNAKVAVLKIYRVLVKYYHVTLEPSHWTRSDIIARALSYEPNRIDIFANAWASTKAFDTLDVATREAIKYNAENGRHGLGTIYVVPSGHPGNELSNNIYTITVNSIGRNGTVLEYTNVDAKVITCGLGEGNNLSSSFMVTTTLNNACVTGFKGVSAATSQIAAIIALAIESNKNLSLRDIQHLLVHASDNKGLQEEKAFRRNAAGKLFHDVLGFGLIDAGKLVRLAKKQQRLPRLLSKALSRYITRPPDGNERTYEFCNDFKMIPDRTLDTVEQVLVNINFTSTANKIRISLKSPNGTTSLLIDHTPMQSRLDADNVQFVSVHLWGERPFGPWSLIVSDKLTKLRSATLILYGTNEALSSYQDMRADVSENLEAQTCDANIVSKNVTDDSSENSKTNDTKTNHTAVCVISVSCILFISLFILIFIQRHRVLKFLSCPRNNEGDLNTSELHGMMTKATEDQV